MLERRRDFLRIPQREHATLQIERIALRGDALRPPFWGRGFPLRSGLFSYRCFSGGGFACGSLSRALAGALFGAAFSHDHVSIGSRRETAITDDLFPIWFSESREPMRR